MQYGGKTGTGRSWDYLMIIEGGVKEHTVLLVVSEASSSSESESILKSTKDGASSLFFSSEIRLPLLTRSITEEICFLILVVSFASSKVIGVAP